MLEKRSIIDESRDFWEEIVSPLLQARFPAETSQMAAGFFGYGSEVLRLDDEYSTDHHFGLRVNALLPADVLEAKGTAIEDMLAAQLPQHWPVPRERPPLQQTSPQAPLVGWWTSSRSQQVPPSAASAAARRRWSWL